MILTQREWGILMSSLAEYEGQKRHLATFYSVPGSRMDRNRVLLLADTIQAIRLKLHAQRKAAK